MIKSLLTSVALVATVLTANTTEVTLWEGTCDFGVNWAESFAIEANDLQKLDDESATFEMYYSLNSECAYWQYKLASNGEGWNPLNYSVENGNNFQCISVQSESTKTSFSLGAEDIATIKANGIRIQGYGMIVTKVVWNADVEIDPNLLWEGEAILTGWASGADVAPSKLKVGDVLEYTISNPGAENGQVLVKGNDWNNLLGTAKITPKDMVAGTVLVGVTQDMLDNCGGKIFLQGDGGATITKVYRQEAAFDAENVLAYGNRSLGTSVFVTIPEGTNYINATFTKVPEWLQLCNSSWTEIAQPVNRIYSAEDAPVTYQFEATPELVAAINDKKEVVFNGGGAELVSLSVADELVLDYDPAKLLVVADYENFDLDYNDPIEIPYADMPGLGKTTYMVFTYDRIAGAENYSLDLYAIAANGEPVEITRAYIPYGTGDIIVPLNEELANIIKEGGIKIEGEGATITKIYYSEDKDAGIADVTVDADAPVEYYNLQGIKISADDATNGIFIRRQGGKSMKVAR